MPQQPTRRAALAAGLGALGSALLAGCDGGAAKAPMHGTSATDGSSATGSSAPSSPTPTPSATVTAATGPVAVVRGPTRVVALDTAELDSAMTLGITPVGAAKAPADGGLPGYWPASRLAGITVVGDIAATPDTVRIAALAPQLILSNQTRDGAHPDALRPLAPTVLTRTTGYPWKDGFRLHAAALDRQEQADAVVAAYERHADQATRAIAAAGSGGRRISIVRFVEGSPTVRLYARQNFVGTVLADLGLPRPDPQNVDQFTVEVPADQLARADGDYLFYATYGDPDRAGTTAALAGPVWQSLAAVRAHRAFPVDDQLWFQGIGYTGANFLIAELQRALGA
ncbi:iron-siderophore ABC transporter substrate-binding protein [Kitasatospora paracochleata]|uniref:Iron complex transport system substrate-binding protein n=1 Tax=Kitasatospora paracochleata TaxID=58354 RepID=A0ABT1IPN8_9ACTN|nr:iron-siderophore ABC transporter substrate-binding protein [Kitasatospora paracochleata]MCP2307090.1 iron complex transport system substrate-binding protein [Kitasatospora paracochleata]